MVAVANIRNLRVPHFFVGDLDAVVERSAAPGGSRFFIAPDIYC
jgi:hypothetical protein